MEFQLHYLEEPKERTIAESNNALNEIPAAVPVAVEYSLQ